MKKGSCPKTEISTKKEFEAAQWKSLFGSSSYKNIMTFPGSTVYMETLVCVNPDLLLSSIGKQQEIDYRFVTDFSDSLDISLNIGFFRYLQEILQAYGKALSVASTMTLDGEDSSQSAVKPVSGALPLRPAKILFKPLAPLILEPQLRVMGDATPRFDKVLGWIG